jgi:hypothetical protein
MISQILYEDLRQKKTDQSSSLIDSRMEQKQQRFTSCQDFIQIFQGNPHTLDCIVTGDESWAFQYGPETKRQSMQWISKSSPRPKILFAKVQDQKDADHNI